jgi:hypothetical protein
MNKQELHGGTPIQKYTEINPITGRPYHPDRAWLTKITSFHPCGDGWVICGTLSFKIKHLHTQNEKVKSLFGALNWHMNGEFNWKNVPVYWRWEYDSKERIHCHFVLMDATPEFHYLRGSENSFADEFALVAWLKSNWTHGVSHFRRYEDEGWLNYLTKDNPLLQSCYAPPIHYLKRKCLEKRSLEVVA